MKVIDLSKAHKHFHPDIKINNSYLVKIYGTWYLGKFTQQWFGLNFAPWTNGNVGIQFDASSFNFSKWEKVIEIDLNELDNLK